MKIILTGDNGGFLKASLEQAGHKVFAIGPNSPQFPLRMEMLTATHAAQIMARATGDLAGTPSVLVHAALMDGPFGHVMHANLTARFILNEAFLQMHAQAQSAGEASAKNVDGTARKFDEETSEVVEKVEEPLDLRIVQLIGFPILEETTQIRCAKVAQLALAMDLSERIEALGLPLSSAVVSAPQVGEASEASVADSILQVLAAEPQAYKFQAIK